MEITGKIINFNKDYKTNKAIVTLLLDVKELEEIEQLSFFRKANYCNKKIL